MRFDHPDDKYRLPEDLHTERSPPPGYPLRLLTLIRGSATHSQILPEDQKVPPTVWISSDSTLRKDLNTDRAVFLVSPLGRLRVEVREVAGVHPEALIYRRGDWLQCGGGGQPADCSQNHRSGGRDGLLQPVRQARKLTPPLPETARPMHANSCLA